MHNIKIEAWDMTETVSDYITWSVIITPSTYTMLEPIKAGSMFMATAKNRTNGDPNRETWTPDVASSVYAKVLIDPTGETIPDWEQPDSTNAYMTGDKVRFEGVVYESTIDNNIWSPTAYPAGWKIVL